MSDIFILFGLIFGFGLVVVAPFAAVGTYGQSRECSMVGGQMGVRHVYSVFGGCVIEPKPGKWIQLEQYHQISE